MSLWLFVSRISSIRKQAHIWPWNSRKHFLPTTQRTIWHFEQMNLARASRVSTSLSCTINLKWPVVFLIIMDVTWNLISSDSWSSFLGWFLIFVIAFTCSTYETSRNADNEVKQCTISTNISIYSPCIDNR